MQDNYASIFIKGDISLEDSRSLVAEYCGRCANKHGDIISDEWDLTIRNNPDPCEEPETPDAAFLGYPYKMEAEYIKHPTNELEIAQHFGELLTYLWDRGLKAVAVCNFESLLPRSGRNDLS